MRTTLTIDPDVWAQIERRRRHDPRSLKDEVNGLLRLGLLQAERAPSGDEEPFETQPLAVGRCLLDSLDDVADVLAFAEGEDYK